MGSCVDYGINHMANAIVFNYCNGNIHIMDTPSQRLKAARKLKGLNQVQLARVTGIDQSTISDIENDKGLSAEYLMRLCDALDETPQHIMRGVKTDLSVLAQVKALVNAASVQTATHNHLQGKTRATEAAVTVQDETAKLGINLAASGPGKPKASRVVVVTHQGTKNNDMHKTKRVQKQGNN